MNLWEVNDVFGNVEGDPIIFGDFNTGPEITTKNISGELPDNYAQIENLGTNIHTQYSCQI